MFTGIITDIGCVRALQPAAAGSDMRLVIETGYDTADIALGASICCSGACLTVVDRGPGWFAVEASAETLARTTLGAWQAGTRVNLERALRLGDELGGHLVSGHVDGVARIVARQPEGGSLRLVLETAAALGRYIAPKGSVALDGVSLTVNEVEDTASGSARFGINIILHTQAQTTFGAAAPGARVNLEVDVLARYVARMKDAS
ncbi:MAG: riboflavin synthase [Proteobacteria bacterium]|nr:riboflavin synthase [Pseudomonadota bacterium]